jgi:hypothetical protein
MVFHLLNGCFPNQMGTSLPVKNAPLRDAPMVCYHMAGRKTLATYNMPFFSIEFMNFIGIYANKGTNIPIKGISHVGVTASQAK